jgi:hypothetical protein
VILIGGVDGAQLAVEANRCHFVLAHATDTMGLRPAFTLNGDHAQKLIEALQAFVQPEVPA